MNTKPEMYEEVYGYQLVYCHVCGNQVCLACGCCCNPSCEMFSCPERKEEIKDYEEYLEKIRKLAENIVKPDFKSKYPSNINTSGKRALYDNLDKDENLVEDLHKSLIEGIPDGWKSSRIKERVVRNILLKYLKEEKIDEILEILRNQGEY